MTIASSADEYRLLREHIQQDRQSTIKFIQLSFALWGGVIATRPTIWPQASATQLSTVLLLIVFVMLLQRRAASKGIQYIGAYIQVFHENDQMKVGTPNWETLIFKRQNPKKKPCAKNSWILNLLPRSDTSNWIGILLLVSVVVRFLPLNVGQSSGCALNGTWLVLLITCGWQYSTFNPAMKTLRKEYVLELKEHKKKALTSS